MENRHTHNGIDSPILDPKFFRNLPVFTILPAAKNAPSEFIYLNGTTYRIYFRTNIGGVADLYYVALTKV